jgi:hypothetical protein
VATDAGSTIIEEDQTLLEDPLAPGGATVRLAFSIRHIEGARHCGGDRDLTAERSVRADFAAANDVSSPQITVQAIKPFSG